MSIDPRVLFLGGQAGASVPDLGSSLLKGIKAAQAIKSIPIMEEMQKLQLRRAKAQAEGQPVFSRAPQQIVDEQGKPGLAFVGVNPVTGQSVSVPVPLQEGLEFFRQDPEAALARRVEQQRQLNQLEVQKQRAIEDIEVTGAGRKEQARLLAKSRQEITNKFRESSKKAIPAINIANRMDAVLKDLETGNIAAVRQKLSAVPGFGGLKDAKAEEFVSLVNQGVLANAEQLTGVLSDTDIALLKEIGPQLINTPEGNKRIVNAMRAGAEHARKENERYKKFLKQGGKPEDFIEQPVPEFLSGQQLPQGNEGVGTGEFEGFKIIR